MELGRRPDSLDRGDLGAIRHALGPGYAGQGQIAIYNHRTGTAVSIFTGDLGTRQQELLTQYIAQ